MTVKRVSLIGNETSLINKFIVLLIPYPYSQDVLLSIQTFDMVIIKIALLIQVFKATQVFSDISNIRFIQPFFFYSSIQM